MYEVPITFRKTSLPNVPLSFSASLTTLLGSLAPCSHQILGGERVPEGLRGDNNTRQVFHPHEIILLVKEENTVCGGAGSGEIYSQA